MREREMNCKDICELLTAYLDGEVMPEERANIEAHLPGCPECRAELEALSATRASLRGVLKSTAEEVSPSPQEWENVRARLDTKGSWLDGLRRLLTNKTWQVAAVTAAVVVIAAVAAIWQFGGVSQAPPPAPTPTPVPTPTPRPAPPPPFERSVVPEEAHYLPGESVEVKLSLTNIASDTITMSPYPPEIRVTPWLDRDRVLSSRAGGTQPLDIEPGDTIALEFTWDQKNAEGEQAPPGWYAVTFKDISVTQGDRRTTFNPTAKVLIQYPQGAMEKSLDLNQSQTVNDITITLERVELTATGMKFYAFNTPPGYSLPLGQPGPAPSFWIHAEAEYSIDGGSVSKAGSSGIRFLDNGTRHTWNNLDPVPSDAKELTIRITQLGDWEGYWDFRVPLE
jgi:hypothetical protein